MGVLRWFEVVRGPGVKVGHAVHVAGDVFQERPEDRFGPLLEAGRIRVTEAPSVEVVTETVEAPSVSEAATGRSPARVTKQRRGAG